MLSVAATAAPHAAGVTVTQAHAFCTSSGTLVTATVATGTVLSVTGVALGCPFTVTAGFDGNILIGAESLAAGAVTVIVPIGGFLATNISFQSIVSNARVGSTVAGKNATRLGVTQVGAFTISTKLPHRNRYVTYRIDFGIGAAHQLVAIWGATKHGNDWTAFTRITSRVANASGVVYYYIRQSSLTWKSYRGNWIGGGVWTPARQTHWIR
jgi:hypothetical protein